MTTRMAAIAREARRRRGVRGARWRAGVRDYDERAASPRQVGSAPARQRNLWASGWWMPSTASAMIGPITGANLKAWPEPPVATVRLGRWGWRAIQKWASRVSQ